jgi:hypothetical protein
LEVLLFFLLTDRLLYNRNIKDSFSVRIISISKDVDSLILLAADPAFLCGVVLMVISFSLELHLCKFLEFLEDIWLFLWAALSLTSLRFTDLIISRIIACMVASFCNTSYSRGGDQGRTRVRAPWSLTLDCLSPSASLEMGALNKSGLQAQTW